MDLIHNFFQKYKYRIQKVSFYLSILAIIAFIYDYGWSHTASEHNWVNIFYEVSIILGIISIGVKHIYTDREITKPVKIFDLLSVVFLLIILFTALINHGSIWAFTIFFIFIREFSTLQINYGKNVINPGLLFVYSFIVVITLGSFLLMLPRSTTHGIDYIDALFISTSAVCVTGLSTIDFSADFTPFGQTIVLLLIQIGGLGIMTFASYFTFFFRGATSYQNQLTLSEFVSNDKLGEVYSIIKKIVITTLSIELLGAIFIYFSIDMNGNEIQDPIFFSLFHSISAFCNAGFSTMSDGLFHAGISTNYNLHLIIAALIVLGGLGFPIVFNFHKYGTYKIQYFWNKIRGKHSNKYVPWVLNLNSRISLITTFALFMIGFISFFIFEFNHSLEGQSLWGKFVGSIFGSVTPRTAGFNTIDMTAMNFPTIMIYFLLMWIGASPASTGGGIKTNTFAVAAMNFMSLAKGKDRVEVFRRELSFISIRRAFSVMMLSLLVIGLAITIMETYEYDKGLLSIAFECFSAYSTVGLSLGITGDLTNVSKVVLICVMIIGRVSILTILIALIPKEKYKNYRYPSDDILIN
ncbi:ATPase [Flavobacteriaceae bacterium Ap0902]|nr:ATPase [Flavobacteriaceae bacterium Ap0902]